MASSRFRRFARAAFWVYLLLLVVSHVVRRQAPPPALESHESAVELTAVDGARELPDGLRLVYRDYPADRPGAPTIVLLHGSPGNKENFDDVAPRLAGKFRVIVPDLPGFGSSTSRIPDYSIRAHARYVDDLLGELDVRQVHLVGFSMGGGVALELYDRNPDRVGSLILLSAIGVQELEFLGDYELNHLVHGLQLAIIWAAFEATPHMGLLDGFPLDRPYARNFYDTDQRPLRGILERFEPPMMILHGEDDFLVAPEVALEHRRIVPQADLQMLDESHFMVFTSGKIAADRINRFVMKVEAGRALPRSQASPSRRVAAEVAFDRGAIPPASGMPLVVLVLMIAAATLVSEDLTCIAVGLMVGQGRIGFLPGVLACFLGIYVGDLLLYLAGRVLGRAVVRRAPIRWILSDEQVESASQWFRRRGPIVIGLSRFLPGARLPTYFAAGTLRTSFWAFSFYFFVAVAAWTPLLVAGSMLIGRQSAEYFERLERHYLLGLLLVGLQILIVVKLIVPLLSHRGRRRWAGAWGRWTRWEFWPPWLFYPPVMLYILWLGIRHRAPLLFTAANPAIPAGGVISEPKIDALDALSVTSVEFVARARLIPSGGSPAERSRRARHFITELELSFPVVLKPNAGQRGSGVTIVRRDEQIDAYFERSRCDTLVQEFVAGDEFGVFYYRLPGEAHGQIYSITEKKLPVVVGDGRQTVEQLILADPRAVCMARHYLRLQAGRLSEVPAEGEAIELADLGTHCRGAIFLDGSGLSSEALERAIDRISHGYEGFFFGRYDLKAASPDELSAGRDFKILELNGVTSEATHIYDPKTGLAEAYRVLFRQWGIAFEIGRRNRDRGIRPTGPTELIRMLRDYRATSRSHPDQI